MHFCANVQFSVVRVAS